MSEFKDYKYFLAELSGETPSGIPDAPSIPTRKIQREGYAPGEFSVDRGAIYDRLNDGTYSAKYDTYKTGIGEEERLAKQQTWYEQAGAGLGKMIAKTGAYALDATVGTAYGAISALSEGRFAALYDNDFSKTVDDWNKKLDNKLHNYYTEEEKSRGLLAAIPGFGASNFWFNDVGGGLAFVGGAILPELAIGALSGGTTLGAGIAKAVFKSGAKKLGQEGAELGIKTALKGKDFVKDISAKAVEAEGKKLVQLYNRSKAASQVGNAISTGGFLLRTSNFEAGMEARHNFKDAVSTYMETFEDKNGRQPSKVELTSFIDDARKAANGVYGANLAILAVSNAAMFGKAFNLKTPTISNSLKNQANRVIGLGTKREIVEEGGKKILKTSLIESSKAQRVLGKAYKILGKPAMEGIYEEGFQGVAGGAMQNYLEAKYDPKADSAYSMMASLTDAFAEQYGTKEGWKEMGIGMIIGSAGGTIQGQGFAGFGKDSYGAAKVQKEEDVATSNAGITMLRSMNRASSIRNFRNMSDSKADNYESTSAENTMANYEFIKSQEHMKSTSEVKEDYETVIDNIQLEKEEMEELTSRGISLDEYKSSLKEEFNNDVKSYNFAKNTVEALGLDRQIKDASGSIHDIKDAITMNLMLGKNSEYAAKNTGKQIGQLIGVEGMFDSMKHYADMTDTQKSLVEELKVKDQQLKDATQAATDLGIKIASLPRGSRTSDKFKTSYENEATKLTVAQVRIQQIMKEKESIENALNSQFDSSGFTLNSESLVENRNITITEILDNLDKLDTYTNSLRSAGKITEADSIDYLVEQFKSHSEASKEMTSIAQQMRDTNFFSSKKGKGMVKAIVGEKFEIDEELEKAIEENDEYIRRSIAAFKNIPESDIDVKEQIRASIVDNPALSEREKYRLSSILRVQLGLERVKDKAKQLEEVMLTTDVQKATSPLDGDTVSIRQAQAIKESEITTIEALDNTIKEITEELDFLVTKSKRNKTEIEALEAEKERLQKDTTADEVKKQLEDQLRELEASEFKTPEAVEELKKQIKEIKPTDNSKRIAEIDEKLSSMDKAFKIIDSPEYLRLNELYKKKETKGLNGAEQDELFELEQDINQWLLVTGTIVGGLRLSDLIRQKVALEEMEIRPLENVETVTSKDTEDTVEFSDKSRSTFYDITQTNDAVTATLDPKTNLIEIAGISAINLALEIGEEFAFLSGETTNTVLIAKEEVERINAIGKVKILPTNQNLDTNYSVVTTVITDISGNEVRVPLKSTFNTERTRPQNIAAVFSAQIDDELLVEVDSNDQWNKDLFDEYERRVGLSNITEEQEEALVDALHSEKKAADKIIQTKTAEISKLEEELKDNKLKEREKNAKKKKITTLSNQILSREDILQERAQKEIDKLKGITPNQKEIEDQLDYIARTLVIKVTNKDGEYLSDFKSVRDGKKGVTGELFEALRFQIATETDLIARLVATRGMEKVEVKGLKVKKVFMGHPNYNYTDNADGSIQTEHRRVDAQQAKKVVDIGYVQAGKMSTKSQAKGVDTTFLSKLMKSKSTTKVPFIVFEMGGKRVAYPVQVVQEQKEPLDEFSKVFNSTTDAVTKSIALNKFMAARGLDVTQPGNAFIVAGENNNLTDEFFNNKLAQLESIEYFYSLDNWISATADVQSIVENQVLVDINLVEPLHSPKLQIELKDVKIDPKFRKNTTETEDDQVSVKDAATENEAEDNINQPC